MLIKILIAVFIIFALYRVIYRYKKQEIFIREAITWFIFWLLVLGATLWPHTTDILAKIVGIGRGADLLIFISIVVLFFLVFRIIVKLEKINRDITKIVRRVALENKEIQDQEMNQDEKIDI